MGNEEYRPRKSVDFRPKRDSDVIPGFFELKRNRRLRKYLLFGPPVTLIEYEPTSEADIDLKYHSNRIKRILEERGHDVTIGLPMLMYREIRGRGLEIILKIYYPIKN